MKPDDRLRAALRHAPDADVQAPDLLGARIRAAARQALDGDAKRRPWWQRLTRPQRMGASGAFASLLLAGFIGLLWRGEPPPAVDSAPAPPPAPAAAPAVEAPPPVAARAPAPLPEAPVADAPRAAAPAAAPRREMKALPPPPPAAPAVAEAPAANTAPPPAAPAADAMAQTAEPAAAERQRSATAKMAAPAPAAALGLAAPARPAFSPWVDGGVLWQLSADAPPAAADPSWLQDLARSAQGRWQPSAREDAPAGATRLALARAGAQAQLVIGDDRVQWCSADGPCWVAPLAAADAQRLRAALQR